MSIIHAERTRPQADVFEEPTLPVRPAGEKLCDCHHEPMRWQVGAGRAGWKCRVGESTRARIRNARRAGVPTDGHSREDTFRAGEGRCWICRADLDPLAWDEDHVIPISKDGPDTLANCRPACIHCNRSKGARLYVLDPRITSV